MVWGRVISHLLAPQVTFTAAYPAALWLVWGRCELFGTNMRELVYRLDIVRGSGGDHIEHSQECMIIEFAWNIFTFSVLLVIQIGAFFLQRPVYIIIYNNTFRIRYSVRRSNSTVKLLIRCLIQFNYMIHTAVFKLDSP